jgi:catechol 2,3-dioxygenase-like lactoylglutathione lyase family enzyme
MAGECSGAERGAGEAQAAGGYGEPMTIALFAGIRVRDLTTARAWYERLLGEPSFFPNDIEAVWTVAEERSLYIQEDPGRAGDALVTLFVDDLDAWVAEIGARGLEPAERETYSNGVRKAIYRDDDGNEVGFAG